MSLGLAEASSVSVLGPSPGRATTSMATDFTHPKQTHNVNGSGCVQITHRIKNRDTKMEICVFCLDSDDAVTVLRVP